MNSHCYGPGIPKLRGRKYATLLYRVEYFRFEFPTTVGGTGFASLAHHIMHTLFRRNRSLRFKASKPASDQLLKGQKTDRFRGIVKNNSCFISSMEGVSSRRVCAISEQIVVSSTR